MVQRYWRGIESGHFYNSKEIIQHLSFVYHVVYDYQKNTAIFFSPWLQMTIGRPQFWLSSLCGSMFNHMADLIDSK
jgi:hypothetical protein